MKQKRGIATNPNSKREEIPELTEGMTRWLGVAIKTIGERRWVTGDGAAIGALRRDRISDGCYWYSHAPRMD